MTCRNPSGALLKSGRIAIEGPSTLTAMLQIGTGAGGASAATLAEAGVDVLMLEEGPQCAGRCRAPRVFRRRFRCYGAAAG